MCPTINKFKYYSPFPIFVLLPSLLSRIFTDKHFLIKSCAPEILSQPLSLRNQTQTFNMISICPREKPDTHLLNLYGQRDNCCPNILVLFLVCYLQWAADTSRYC